MRGNSHQRAFFELVKAGLWERELLLVADKDINWQEIYRLAQGQSVLGLVLAGLEKTAIKPPQALLLQWIGEIQMLEHQNKSMNLFIGRLIDKLRKADIYTLLVKGQGIAQCYERPLWRTAGDVDLLLNYESYNRSKTLLQPLSAYSIPERYYSKEIGLCIEGWIVELHGTQRTGLSSRIDKVVDNVQRDVFNNSSVRSWVNNDIQVFIPSIDNDVFFVFTHFIKHFYKEEMNLRQVCDWCRLLWTYKDSLNHSLLKTRIKKAGLMAEWKSFAALSVNFLGMPEDAMPLYSPSVKWNKKSDKILSHILKGSELKKVRDTFNIAKIFPISVLRFAPSIFFNVNLLKIKERLFKSK